MSRVDRGANVPGRVFRALQAAATRQATHVNGTLIAASYTVKPADSIIWVTTSGGAITVTLPPARFNKERMLTVVDRSGNAAANNVTLDGNGAETINGAATFAMNVNRMSITLHCDGTEWYIV